MSDSAYNESLKQRRRQMPVAENTDPDEQTFIEARAASAAMRDVDDEIAARLRGEPCSS